VNIGSLCLSVQVKLNATVILMLMKKMMMMMLMMMINKWFFLSVLLCTQDLMFCVIVQLILMHAALLDVDCCKYQLPCELLQQ